MSIPLPFSSNPLSFMPVKSIPLPFMPVTSNPMPVSSIPLPVTIQKGILFPCHSLRVQRHTELISFNIGVVYLIVFPLVRSTNLPYMMAQELKLT
ncbi:hypothetical protein M8J76_001829 [Diaphorina citri]|nr:hypothetical protein M8J76_001829 [Diaphorina citri]